MAEWVGWDNTDGVPDSASWTDYQNESDRTFGRLWTATEDGTISRINLRISGQHDPGAFGSWAIVYNNGTKVGQTTLSNPTTNAWTDYFDIDVVAGQSLNFETGDDLIFGIAFDGGGTNNWTGLKKSDSGTVYNNFDSTAMTADGPASSLTFGISGSNRGLGTILEYETDVGPILQDTAGSLPAMNGSVTKRVGYHRNVEGEI